MCVLALRVLSAVSGDTCDCKVLVCIQGTPCTCTNKKIANMLSYFLEKTKKIKCQVILGKLSLEEPQ